MEISKDSISDSLVSADWDTIAHALMALHSGIKPKDAESRNMRAKLGLIKILMYENIRSWNGNSSIDLSFFIATYKTIKSLESEFEKKEIRNKELLIFLKLLLYKFEKLKLKAKKPLEVQAEFGKMKMVIEDEFTSL